MAKRYANTALVYAVLALILGVVYREVTKYSGFTGRTTMSFMHAHYFMLGMAFFLVLMLVEKNFHFSQGRQVGVAVIIYQVGLNITVLCLLARGLTQVWNVSMSNGMDASLSGIAGIGHILLSIGMIILLWNIRKKAA